MEPVNRVALPCMWALQGKYLDRAVPSNLKQSPALMTAAVSRMDQ